jgi:flagellar L-ring protein precursor FlgH
MSLLSRKLNFALAIGLSTAAPAVAQQAAPAQPGAQSATPAAQPQTQRPRRSWTSDRRDFVVGDVITVNVDEFTLASANKDNVDSDRRRRNMDLDVDISTGVASPPTRINAGVGTRNDAESSQRGEATRQNRFQGEMSVRVVAVDPTTGNIQVKGQKMVDVDKNKQTVSLTGWVRPQDVSTHNVVDSYRIADVQLVYLDKSKLAKPRGGMIGKIFGMIWP